jgi:uncharacterized protein YndB with AHSA1/START domain
MKKILMVLVVLVLAAVAFVASRPNEYRVERSATLAAPPEVVFAQIDDFHNWAAWSPWEKLDPQMQKSFGGAASGAGAGYHWVGNNQVGEGRMTITESVPNDRVAIKLEFLKPWQSTSNCTFTLAPGDAGTRVTWAMEGKNNFMSKAMGVFVSMDKMIGGDFERGLATLGTVSAAAAAEGAPGARADSTAAPSGS